MNETVLLLAVLIFGVLLVGAMVILVMQLRHRFALEEKKPALKEVKKPIKAKTDLKKAVLIVNSEEFEIYYKPENQDDVIRLTELIKHSLALLKETKYRDIIASRAKECETLIKQLPKFTSLNRSELDLILEQLKEFVDSL